MEDNSTLIITILILYAIGSVIYRYYLPRIKGAIGEYNIARRLKKLNKKKYKVFNDIYLKIDGESTQIDHLVVSVYGIFVIETKNYDGWIHGSEQSAYWTQSFYKNKTKFRNPIKQNWAHIYFLKNILANFGYLKYHSIIVFVGKAKLKNVYSNIPVIYGNEILKTIKKNKTVVLTLPEVEEITTQLCAFIIRDKQEKKEHKNYVKRNIQERKRNIRKSICPNCKGTLVLRKGKYGKFYGCENFPKCKFSKKIN